MFLDMLCHKIYTFSECFYLVIIFKISVIHIWKRKCDIQIKGHYNIWWELYIEPCVQSSPHSKLQLPTSVDPESANEKTLPHYLGFPGDPAVKNLHTMWVHNPWVGKIPGEENGNPLQYSCLENSMDRGAWWATVHRVTKSQTQLKWLSTHAV